MHCLLDVRVVHCCLACFQGVVLPPVARRAEPHVLPVRVRQQQQLQPADQPRLQRQPGPPPLLPLHRQIHCHGKQHVGMTRGKKRLRLLADLLRLTRRKRVGLIAAGMETRKHCMQGGGESWVASVLWLLAFRRGKQPEFPMHCTGTRK